MAFIDEIYLMDDIFSYEQETEKRTGIRVQNVSHWDSSHLFQSEMSRSLEVSTFSLPWDYYYTYSISIEDRIQVLKKLGIPSASINSTIGLLLQSSTIAIVNMINLLVHYNKKRLCIVQPAYFSVAECCKMFSLDYAIEYISFDGVIPQIPIDRIVKGGYDCVWLTSPIFCTGKYYESDQIKEIIKLKDMGFTIVFDESLALPGRELLRSIPIDSQVFAIYSPHKAISINGLKFSVLVSDRCYEDFLEQWVDVFSGALSSSNRDAVFHYISNNYVQDCLHTYKKYTAHAKKKIVEVVDQFPIAKMLDNTEGHYITIFTKTRFEDTNQLMLLMQSLISQCFASFLPGILNGFDEREALCFRINLTGDYLETPDSVRRILEYLSSHRHYV